MRPRRLRLARTATAVLATGVVLSLGACASDGPDGPPTPPAQDTNAAPGDGSFLSGDDLAGARAAEQQYLDGFRERMLTPAPPVEVGPSCEEFNAIMADSHAVGSDDDGAGTYDMYMRAMDAKQVAPDETFRLFDTLSQVATERMEGDASQPALDAVSDAVSDTEAACATAGVTLTP